MDDRRFDSITRAFATSANRRTLIKGLLGLGGVAAIGTVVDDDGADAATRPTPTPKPPTCPGVQTWNSTLKKCVCPANLSQCVPGVGPACCNDIAVAPGAPGYSTCCDNACCQGTCYDEELCCATNTRTGGLPPTNRICDSAGGTDCCLYSDECCTIDGCCSTTCYGGNDGESYCCPAGDWCPGGSTSPELCCEGNTVCCGANTNVNVCTDLSDDDNNCGACGNVCGGCSSCQNGVCVADDGKCEGTQVCCPKDGTFTCETGPYCGCDVDSDCPGTNPATCQYGWCDQGTCRIRPADSTTLCHPAGAGANAICDPAVYCTGETESCPGPDYAVPGTDCGDCMSCNATGVCEDNCPVGLCCSDDFCADQPGECCTDAGCVAPDTCTAADCVEHQCNTASACAQHETCCGDGIEGCSDTNTDSNNCGRCGNVCQGCSTCQGGVCTADDNQCEGTDVCCPDGNTFTCQAGPFCGCDNDGECGALSDPLSCKEGWCDAGTCKTRPAPSSTVCHAAGASAICDPAVMCSGTAESCPGTNYAPSGTDCGNCMTCNGTGTCNSTCAANQDCCPGAVDYCIPDGATCCSEQSDCDASYCDGLTWHNIFCNVAGYCVDEPQNCADTNLCTNDFCDAATGCSHTPVVCNTPPTCFTGPGTCDPADGQCDYTPVICNTPPGVCYATQGTCTGGNCVYTPLGSGVTCGDCLICDGAGACVDDPACACTPIDGICTEDAQCCEGECCNPLGGEGVCKVPDNEVCVVNSDCCVAAGSCCREVGHGLQCKPGLGQCHCDSDADCAVIPGGLICNLTDHTCEHP